MRGRVINIMSVAGQGGLRGGEVQESEQKEEQKQQKQEQPPSPSVFWESPFRELIFGTGLEAGRQTNNPPSISGDPALWNEVQSKPRWGPAGDEGVREDEEKGRKEEWEDRRRLNLEHYWRR